jgi:hypothetical protein
MGFIGSRDGRIHVSIDGMDFSYPSITRAEAARLNSLIDGRRVPPRHFEKPKCKCCGTTENVRHVSKCDGVNYLDDGYICFKDRLRLAKKGKL